MCPLVNPPTAVKLQDSTGAILKIIGPLVDGQVLGVTASGTEVIGVTVAGSTPTGTGFTHITGGVQDSAAKLVDTADINNLQVTAGKIANNTITDAQLSSANKSTAFDAAGAAAAAQAASQPLDADLTAIAALSTTSFGRSFLTLADASAGRTLLALGTAATQNSSAFDAAGAAAAAQAASQPLDSDLTAIAALGTTSFGRSFLTLADAAAGRTLLTLGTAATQDVSAFDAAGSAAAAQAASQPLDSDLTAIAGLTTTTYGRSQLTLADAAADTAQLNLVTTALKGLMSTADKKRMAQVYDAVADFGFVGDLVTVFDGACSTGANTKITSATAAFNAATDVGKRITLAGAGASGAMYVGTISAVDSATQVTVSPTISTTVSAKGLGFGTDNTTAISNMTTLVNTTNATFPGVRIIFGQSATNAYGFPTRAVFNKPVQIEGIGGGHNTDTGDYTRIGGTRLAWWGTSSDSGVNFSAFLECSPTGVQSLKRVAFRHCWLDCRNGDQNQALYGLKLASCHGFMLEDFFIMDALASGLWTDIDSDPTEAKDTTRFFIRDFCSRQLDNPAGAITTPFLMTSAVVLTTSSQSLTVAANSLPSSGYIWTATTAGAPVLVRYTGGGGTTTLTGCVIAAEDVVHTPTTVNGGNIVQAVPGNGASIIFSGGSGANTCCGLVTMVQLSHGTTWGPAAVETRNADSIDFIQMMINGGDSTNDGAINRRRKPGVRLNGSIVSATLASRNLTFRGGSAGAGGVSAMGVNNAGARLLAQSGPNYWDLYQLGNGEAIPVVEGNCYFDWQPNGGWRYGQRGATSVADQSISAATLTSLTGSLMTAPPQGFQVGTTHMWRIHLTSGAAGTGTGNIFTIRIGTAGTTADAAVATFTTLTVGTAVVSEVIVELTLTVRTIGAAATVYASCNISNAGAAGTGVGFISALQQTLVPTLATFNSTTAQQFINVCLTTSTGKTATIREVVAECKNPSNP